MIHFSVIVPVYNRPDEMVEFLDSLSTLTDPDFDALVLESPSSSECAAFCASYSDRLTLLYHLKSPSRCGLLNHVMRFAIVI